MMTRLYRLLLFLFPPAFRRRFGDDMAAVFEDRWRAARADGIAGECAFLIRAAADTVNHGLAERRAARAVERSHGMMWGSVVQDVSYGLRSFRRRPGFTAAAVATLALGIGANVAVFSVVRAVMLPDLPYPDPDRITNLYLTDEPGRGRNVVSAGDVGAWRRGADAVFSAMAAYDEAEVSIVSPAGPLRARAAFTEPALFRVMSLPPLHGRPLVDSDGARGERVAVLGHALWRSAFGADPDVIDTSVRIDGEPWTIVGVMPPGPPLPEADVEVWVPMALPAEALANFNSSYLSVIARLRPGVHPEHASQALSDAHQRYATEYVEPQVTGVVGLQEDTASRVRGPLFLLQGVTIAVLLIACVNVANLVLAASTARARELAVRRALGAGGWRVARQLLTEDLLLAGAGGLAGVVLAAWLAPMLVAAYPAGLPLGQQVGIGGLELAAAVALCSATVLVFGLAPALAARRTEAGDALKGARHTAGRRARFTRSALVTAEVALALLLLTGGGLLVKSYLTLTGQPLGFDPRGVLTAEIGLPSGTYPSDESRRAFIQALTSRLGAQPGVRAVGITSVLPFVGFSGGGYRVDTGEGEPVQQMLARRNVSPGYLEALGGELLRGRYFTEADSAASGPVAVVSESFAAAQGGDVLGIRIGRSGSPWMTVVGIVRDARSFFTMEPMPELLLPAAQDTPARFWMLIRSAGADAGQLEASMRDAVRVLDAELPIDDVRPLESAIGSSIARQRFNMAALALLACVAAALTLIGVYGVTSYVVGLRKREIGIRVALGARPGQVRSLIVRQGLIPILAGTACGVLGAFWASRVLESELFQVTPHDPLTFAAAAGMFFVAGLLSNWLPAGRAASADPASTLRTE